MRYGNNCARCLSPCSPNEVVRQTNGVGAWKPCSGLLALPALGVTYPKSSDLGKPWCIITAAGVKTGFGCRSFRFCSRKAPLTRLASLSPLPNGLSGAVVLSTRGLWCNGTGKWCKAKSGMRYPGRSCETGKKSKDATRISASSLFCASCQPAQEVSSKLPPLSCSIAPQTPVS